MIDNIDKIDKAIEDDLIQCSLQQNLEKLDFGQLSIADAQKPSLKDEKEEQPPLAG